MGNHDPHLSRRALMAGAASLLATPAAACAAGDRATAALGRTSPRTLAPRLRPGDRVGLVNPATAAFDPENIDIKVDALRALGLEPVLSPHYFDRRGYFAGADEARAADLMGFIEDDSIRGIWARGGWGSARVLPHLDYDAIARTPKVIVGYSDSTALLSGIRQKAGLVVFHGPFPERKRTAARQKALLMDNRAELLENPREVTGSATVQREHRIRTLNGGRATGPLVGGNLTVLTSIIGTPYAPDFDGAILFLEDVDEAVYRIDRMMTQLALSGALGRIAGFVFGRCTDCPPGDGHGSLTLEDVLRDHVLPLGIPAFRGAMVGHIPEQFTLPLGAAAEIDADAGTIRLLETGLE